MKLTRWSKAEIDAAPAHDLDWLLKIDEVASVAAAERANREAGAR